MKESDVFDFARSVNADTKRKGAELVFKLCPYCDGGDHRDKETFSINLETGAFICHRSSCGHSGHFVELARDFHFPLEFEQADKHYRTLQQKEIRSSDPALAYMEKRGISRDTAQKYKITTQKDHKNVLVFPFFDENNVLVSVKYRKTDFDRERDKCKEWFEPNTKPILFGMNHCAGFDRLIITEGQIDALSVSDCGFDNVVSVPNGANGFTWLPLCYEWVQQFKEIIVFGDCERGKVTFVDQLVKRLMVPVKVVRVEDYLGEKDANDILRNYGKGAVRTCIENAVVPKLENVVSLCDVQLKDFETIPKIKTNVAALDTATGGFFYGDLIALTGRCGEGKSTFMSQLICEALEQGERVFIYSGELNGWNVKQWLLFQLAGSKHLLKKTNTAGETYFVVDPDAARRIEAWYSDRAFLYQNDFTADDGAGNDLLHTVEQAIIRYAVRVIFIDNLMTAMEGAVDQSGLFVAQSKFVGSLKRLALKYDVVILLVAHPRKDSGRGNSFDNDAISGSGDITNKADLVLCYRKDEEGTFDSKLLLTKNRHNGRLLKNDEAIGLVFSPNTKRIATCGDNVRVYGWENETPAPYRTDDFEEIFCD